MCRSAMRTAVPACRRKVHPCVALSGVTNFEIMTLGNLYTFPDTLTDACAYFRLQRESLEMKGEFDSCARCRRGRSP
jgi:hypothetical protein